MPVHGLLRSAPLALCAVAAVALSGCGGQNRAEPAAQHPTPRASVAASAKPAAAVKATYTMTSDEGEDGTTHQVWEVVARGAQVRLRFVSGQSDAVDPGYMVVWDGTTLLTHDPASQPVDVRVEHPDPATDPPPVYLYQAGSAAFASLCKDARETGRRTVAGRAGRSFHCAVGKSTSGEAAEPHDVVLDIATGLLLRDTSTHLTMTATAVTSPAQVDDATFSTHPARTGRSALPPFALPRLDGGTLSSADYTGRPIIVVVATESGVRRTLDRLLPLTSGGTAPPVIVLLAAVPPAGWTGTLLDPKDANAFVLSVAAKVGKLPVPTGIDVKSAVAARLLPTLQVPLQDTLLLGLRADGALDWQTTEADFEQNDEQLTKWVGAHS